MSIKKKKSILKKYTGRGGPNWKSDSDLMRANDAVNEKFFMRSKKGFLRSRPGDEEDGFGNKLKNPNFMKKLRSFQEDKKISGLA